MTLSRIATDYITTVKTNDLIFSWDTIKSIVDSVLDDCLRITGRCSLDAYKVCWRLKGIDSDVVYLVGLNPNLIVMHTHDNKDNPFVTIRFNTSGVIAIDKCIDEGHMQPLFTCEAGLELMSGVVDKIISRLDETFRKKEEENEMNQNELYDKYQEVLTGFARAAVTSVINSVTAGTASTKNVNISKNVNTSFEPSASEKGLNSLIKNVIINEPSIIVFWTDGSKTIVKCAESDTFDPEIGICIAFMKKFLGNTGNYHQILRRVIKNAKNVTGEANKKREARKAKKEAAKRKKEEEAEKRVDNLLNETQSPATIGFLNVEEE